MLYVGSTCLKESTGDGDFDLKCPLQVVAAARAAVLSLGL